MRKIKFVQVIHIIVWRSQQRVQKNFMPKGLDESQEKRHPNCTKDKQLVRNNKKQAA